MTTEPLRESYTPFTDRIRPYVRVKFDVLVVLWLFLAWTSWRSPGTDNVAAGLALIAALAHLVFQAKVVIVFVAFAVAYRVSGYIIDGSINPLAVWLVALTYAIRSIQWHPSTS